MKKAWQARDQKLLNADDVSEVETVVPSNALFSLDVNIDNLKDHLGNLKNYIQGQESFIKQLEIEVRKRATEKSLGMYLERISVAIPQTMGERPHAFKLNDPGFFDEEFDTEHGHLLKMGVEKIIEKLEILSAVTIKNRKFK